MSTKLQLLADLPRIPPEADLQTTNVLIVEWLPDSERKTGSELHDWMSTQRKGWSQIKRCRSKQEVLSAIAEATDRARRSGYRPVVHLEAHGDKYGLEGPTGNGGAERLSWEELNRPLQELNLATEFNLAVFMAACEGLAALQSLCVGQRLPTVMLAGPTTTIYPGELFALTKEFYREWKKLGASAADIANSAARELEVSQFGWEPSVLLLYEGFVRALLLRGQHCCLLPHVSILQAEWNQLVAINDFPANVARFGLDVAALCWVIDSHYAEGGDNIPDLFDD